MIESAQPSLTCGCLRAAVKEPSGRTGRARPACGGNSSSFTRPARQSSIGSRPSQTTPPRKNKTKMSPTAVFSSLFTMVITMLAGMASPSSGELSGIFSLCSSWIDLRRLLMDALARNCRTDQFGGSRARQSSINRHAGDTLTTASWPAVYTVSISLAPPLITSRVGIPFLRRPGR